MLLCNQRQGREQWLPQPYIDEVPGGSINKGELSQCSSNFYPVFIHSFSSSDSKLFLRFFSLYNLQFPPWLAVGFFFLCFLPLVPSPSPAMESSSSHITGDDGEGCNSSESGWTMYLTSPMHGDDGGGSGKGSGSEGSSVDDGYGYINGRGRSGKAYEDYADDDSLASDASTGPAKVKAPSSSLPEGGGKDEDEGREKNGDGGGANEDDDEQDEDGGRTKFSTGSRKKSGKVDKGGEGKSSRRGHSKKGTSSRRSFFFW